MNHSFFNKNLPIQKLNGSNSIFQNIKSNLHPPLDLVKSQNQQDQHNRIKSEQISKQSHNNTSNLVKNGYKTINTNRLKPMKQKTKHGLIEITNQGQLVLDFDQEKYVLMIHSDGNNVNFKF